MNYSILLSLVTLIVVAQMLLLVACATAHARTKKELETQLALNAWRSDRCKKCGERETEASIRQTARVKDSKRRARQRKGNARNS